MNKKLVFKTGSELDKREEKIPGGAVTRSAQMQGTGKENPSLSVRCGGVIQERDGGHL